jgi:arylsulfatase A-like enzyme
MKFFSTTGHSAITRRRIRILAGLLVLIGLLFAGFLSCSKDINTAGSAIDLIAEFPFADKIQDSPGIDFNSPEGLQRLGQGWANPEGKHIWGVGRKSTIRIMNLSASEKTLELDCTPFVYPNMKTQEIAVFLNGEHVGETPLENTRKKYLFPLASSLLREGENILEFRYAYSTIPEAVRPKSNDKRELAVSFASITLRSSSSKRPGQAEHASIEDKNGGNRIVEQPADSFLDYYLEIPPDAVLKVGVGNFPEARGMTYNVFLAEDGSNENHLFSKTITKGNRFLNRWFEISIPLSEGDRRIARLRFEVSSGGPKAAGGKGYWLEPRIIAEPVKPLEKEGPIRPHNDYGKPISENGAIKAGPTDIIIYVVDALRADHLGCYGYHRETSPNIDRFSHDSLLFERFLAETSWTRPSTASLLSGFHQRVHGVLDMPDALRESVPLVSEIFQGHGYTTAFFSTNKNISDVYGFGRGFDYFKMDGFKGGYTSAAKINTALFKWLEQPRDKPLFLYIHATDPHDPYEPEDRFNIFDTEYDGDVDGSTETLKALKISPGHAIDKEVVAHLLALYDGEIRQNDHYFGELISKLKKMGMYENSIIILTSDHGEEFNEHKGFAHGATVYSESIHVPFILKLPRQAPKGRRIREPAHTVDIVPTILDLVGIAPQSPFNGVSLTPLIAGTEMESRMLLSEIGMKTRHQQAAGIYWREWKLNAPLAGPNIRKVKDGDPIELFNIEDDWAEAGNVFRKRPILAKYLRTQIMKKTGAMTEMGTLFGKSVQKPEEELPADIRKQLQALGYLN